MDCKIWADENFDKEFDPNKGEGKEYDWDKVKPKNDTECSFNKRFVKFKESSHRSNNDFLQSLDALIANGQFSISLPHSNLFLNDEIKSK